MESIASQNRQSPNFRFLIEIGSEPTAAGSPPQTEPITYRHGNSPIFYPIKMPGLGKVGNVVLGKCAFADNAEFAVWRDNADGSQRKSAFITWLDDQNTPQMRCQLVDAALLELAVSDDQDLEGFILADHASIVCSAYSGSPIDD